MRAVTHNRLITDRMIYLVVSSHRTGNYLPERDTADLDHVTTVRDIATGQFASVVQVLDPFEHTSRDVTEDIAREVMALWTSQGESLSDWQYEFVEQHVSLQAARSFQRAA